MSSKNTVLFGLGLGIGVNDVNEILGHARLADESGLDLVAISDHPYFGDRIDAYAELGYVLGATRNVSGAVIVTNLLSRPAPILARTLTGLSAISGGRIAALGLGAGGMWDEIVALGVPQWTGGQRIRALEEAIILVRELSGGGDPVTFNGEFYQVTNLAPAPAPTPPIWVGVGGPKGLAVIGRQADGWIPPHAADWRSSTVAEGRPIIDEAAEASGRNPTDIGNVYLVAGNITRNDVPASETVNEEGRWSGGGVKQWVDELTFATLERGAAAFVYVIPPGDSVSDATLKLWAQEVAPAVREAVAKR
jgi:alkanesulfonate monooxygenase SsuD/methylene tetrahydromethanopterin reductase-like flavin-dependent oxidoreductase (luciferase family)